MKICKICKKKYKDIICEHCEAKGVFKASPELQKLIDKSKVFKP